jgi:sugar phosphate permease
LRYRYVVCVCTFLGYIMVFFHRVSPAVIALDMQADFAASGALLGLLGSAYFYSYALMQIPTGLLVDSWGARKTVTASLIVAAGGSVLMGLAPSLGLAIVGRVMVGLGVATVFVSNYKLLSEWFDARGFMRMGGLFQSMGGVGAAGAGVPLAYLSDLFSWRWALVVVGLATLGIGLLFYALVRNRPQEKDWPPIAEQLDDDSLEKVPMGSAIMQVLKRPAYWAVALWAFSIAGVSFALAGLWGGPYLIQVHGLSRAGAGGVLTMLALAMVFGSPIVSWAGNYWGRKPAIVATGLIVLASLAFIWAGGENLPVWSLSVLFFMIGFGGPSAASLQAAVPKEMFPLNIAGTAIGLVNLFPFVGAGILQVVIGGILAHYAPAEGQYTVAGYNCMFMFCTCLAATGVLASLFIPETMPKNQRIRQRAMLADQ